MKSLQIQPIAAFDDNYIWIIHDNHHCIVIDPGNAKPVEAYLQQHQLTLTAILLTHHHQDHTGGVADLLKHADNRLIAPQRRPSASMPTQDDQRSVPVYGALADKQSQRIPTISQGCQDGISIYNTWLDLAFVVIDVPGHTSTHIAYYCPQLASLFCGDTLFAGGCGRLFEGTPAQMHASLTKIAALPSVTRLYCAHEYTLSNLRFALAAEPDNQDLIDRMKQATLIRQQHQATIPSVLELELKTNPFLRVDSTAIIHNLQRLNRLGATPDQVAVFSALRSWKNTF